MDKWVDYIDLNNPEHLWLHHGERLRRLAERKRRDPEGDRCLSVLREQRPHRADAHKVLENDRLRQQGPSARYDGLWRQIKDAFAAKYNSADGRIMGDNQSGYVLALAFNLVPDNLRKACGDRLADLVMVSLTGTCPPASSGWDV